MHTSFGLTVGTEAMGYLQLSEVTRDSYTILDKDDLRNGTYTHKNISFDLEGSLKVIYMCSDLIDNIVITRRHFFFGDNELKVMLWADCDSSEFYQTRRGATKMSITPIYKDKGSLLRLKYQKVHTPEKGYFKSPHDLFILGGTKNIKYRYSQVN